MKTYCIVNPTSGGGKYKTQLVELRRALQTLEPKLHWEETLALGHATQLAEQMVAAGAERLIVIGGDGTLSEVVNGVMPFPEAKRPLIAVLGKGTGGDYSRRLKELVHFPKDLRWLRKAKEKRVDVGELQLWSESSLKKKLPQLFPTTRYFINIAQAGLGGQVVRKVNQGHKKWGALEYPKATLLSALNYHAPRVKLEGLTGTAAPDFKESKLLFLIIAKGRYFAGGMCIAPEAELDNGEFQVLLIPPVSYLSLLYHIPQAYRKRRLGHPKICYYQTKSLKIESLEEPLALDLDGEFFQAQGLSAQVLPGALRILLPNR